MEEKLLLFDDTASAQMEIEGRKKLNQGILELKEVFDGLRLSVQFSKQLLIDLVSNGTGCLAAPAKQALDFWLESSGAPPLIFGAINFQPEFGLLNGPLVRIKQIINEYKINLHDLRFEADNPVFTGRDENAIREHHRYYATNVEERKYHRLVTEYCESSNRLESFIRKKGDPSLHGGLISVNEPLYIALEESEDGILLRPNYQMFEELKAIRDIRNRKH